MNSLGLFCEQHHCEGNVQGDSSIKEDDQNRKNLRCVLAEYPEPGAEGQGGICDALLV
jgi:hypothetical protein